MEKQALCYRKLDDNILRCELCPQFCRIEPDEIGFCGVRRNTGGELVTLIYGEVTSATMDPIEKKPLYHFFPGQPILSLGTKGCNFHCIFCQNWHISQQPDYNSEYMSPENAVKRAERNNSFGIAYTYSEPLIWYEYLLDTGRLARQKGLKNVLVTNGYINPGPLEELLPVIDAMNIDVKSYDEKFYGEFCGGKLKPVLKTAEIAARHCHVEITHLVVPFKAEKEILHDVMRLRDWVIDKLGVKTPLHFSRYFPQYRLELPQTPLELMKKASDIAREKLDYVYLGNVFDRDGGNTLCPGCGGSLIRRTGYQTDVLGIKEGCCAKCGREVDVVGAWG